MKKTKTNRNLKLLASRLGDYEISTRGWLQFSCPFCSDDKKHFGVAPEGNGHCLRCGTDILSIKLKKFVKSMKRVSYSEVPSEYSGTRPKISRRQPGWGLPLTGWTRILPIDLTISSMAVGGLLEAKARKYLKKRGVDLSIFEVGFLDYHPGYVCWLFRMEDEPVYYQGRSFTNSARLRTVNPEIGKPWLKKGDVVFNYDLIESGFEVVLVEGPFDAVAVTDFELGRVGVPLLGKSLSQRQLQLLYRKNPSRLTFMLDPPAKDPDIKLSLNKLCKKTLRTGFNTYVVRWPEKEERDPSDLGPALAEEILDTCTIQYSRYRQI